MDSVISQEEAASKGVIDFFPQKISSPVTREATQFISQQEGPREKPFRLNPLVADQTGISELERLSIEERIEKKALEKLKEIQEGAYQEAFALGEAEGRKAGLEEKKKEIAETLKKLEATVQQIVDLMPEQFVIAESTIVDVIFHLAKELALEQISENPQRLMPILREVSASLQSDQKVSVHLSPEDINSLDAVLNSLNLDNDFKNKNKIVSDEKITKGGCLVETNHGVIDATLELRIKKIWETLKTKKPKAAVSHQ